MCFKRKLIIYIIGHIFLVQPNLFGQNSENTAIPVSTIFYNMDKNTLYTLAYNNGINFLSAGTGTFAFIESGIDWKYNRFLYAKPALVYFGFPSLYTGYVMPIILPVALYLAGRSRVDERLQITGMAVLQSTLISIGYTSVLKGITGRISPGIITVLDHTKNSQTEDFSADFAWGFGRRGFIAGWPSAHTTIAFSTAAVIAEIYPEKTWVKAAAYSYATYIGLGVSLCVHWSSEVFAGILIGYAIGKTVGKSFNQLLQNKRSSTTPFHISLQATGNSIIMFVSW
jgi:membrane-associated phospholipid phosphatase